MDYKLTSCYLESSEKAKLEDFVEFLIDKLKIRDYFANVNISVRNRLSKPNYMGEILSRGRGQKCATGSKKRLFTLNVRHYKTLRVMMVVIAHEFVHLKQYLTGQMVEEYHPKTGETIKWTWHGKCMMGMKYDDLPCETEAYNREEELVYQYQEQKYIRKYREYQKIIKKRK